MEGKTVYFASDIAGVLATAAIAGEGRHPDFYAALRAVAAGFRLEPPQVWVEGRVERDRLAEGDDIVETRRR